MSEVIAHIQKSLNGNMSLVFGPGGNIELVRKSDYDALHQRLAEAERLAQHYRAYLTETRRQFEQANFVRVGHVLNEALARPGCADGEKMP